MPQRSYLYQDGSVPQVAPRIVSNNVLFWLLLLICSVETYRAFRPRVSWQGGLDEEKRGLSQQEMTAVVVKSDESPPSNHQAQITTAAAAVEASDPFPDSAEVKIPPKFQKALDNNPPSRKIVLVHMGKTGGSAVRKNMAASCWESRPDPVQRETCLASFRWEDNRLANQTRHVLHTVDLQPQVIEQATTFLFTIRDPLERIISSYNEAQPAKDCFASLQDFCQALLPPFPPNPHAGTPEQQTECRQRARQIVQGRSNSDVDSHLHYNYRYYSTSTWHKYPQKELLAIRSESQYNDLVHLELALGGTGKFRQALPPPPHHATSSGSSVLSEEALYKLCCALEEELNVYFELYNMALNLDEKDRWATNAILRKKCRVIGKMKWPEWRGECRAKLAMPH